MARFEVELLAFGGGAIRMVDVPEAELPPAGSEQATEYALEAIFKYGQNDFQPRPFPSVSVGDVVRYAGRRFRVEAIGFEEVK